MTSDTTLFEQYARLFGPGHLAQLQSLGHDIIEARREGAWVFDSEGRQYLDCLGGEGSYNLGRHQPQVAGELCRQLEETDQGNFPMISVEKARLAQRLAAFAGNGLECSIFGVMRGETLDCACKVARGVTGRSRLLAFEGGWYGETGFAMSLSRRRDANLYGTMIPDTGTIPVNDIEAARAAIDNTCAAVIVELMQAEHHCRAADPAYLKELADLCREAGALLIVDETQTGFGRCGRKLAFETAGIAPDMLLLGEALGGGMFPIAVTMLTQRVNAFLNEHPMIHLSTFGGSDLGCTVAIKALELYEELKPWEQAAHSGTMLKEELEQLVSRTPLLSVSGEGLLLSLEFADEDRAREVCRAARQHGILATVGRVRRNCVVLRPSLLITAGDVEFLLTGLSSALQDIA